MSVTDAAARSRRPASTTRRSSARGGCGRCTRRCCATPPGSGRLAEEQPEREWRTEYRRRHADVLVIGGGAAGLSAAAAAAQLGADVVLVDEGPEPGGRLLVEESREEVRTMVQAAREAGVEIIERGSALGFFDGLVPVWQGDTLHQIRARRHVLATGTIEQPLVFAGNDLPGVMLSDGARRLAAMYAVQPGTRAVVATTSDRGLEAAIALHARGRVGRRRRRPAADPGRAGAGARPAWDRGAAAPHDRRSARQEGGQPGACSRPSSGGARSATLGLRPGRRLRRRDPRELAAAAGRRADALRRGARALRDHRHARARRRGRRGRRRASRATRPPTRAGSPGSQAAHALGFGDVDSRAAEHALRDAVARAGDQRTPVAVPPAAIGAERGKCFACLCEDVTSKDIGHQHRRGLRLDRARQALHDGDDGPVPGPHVPGAVGPGDGPADGPVARRRRHHDRAPAVGVGADGDPRRPDVRARQAVVDPRPPPRARRRRQVGRRLAQAVRLRRPAGRGARRPPGRGADRRVDARQAAGRRAPTPASSSTACTPTASRTSRPAGSATG